MKRALMIVIIAVLVLALLFMLLPFILGGLSGGVDFYGLLFKTWFTSAPPKPQIMAGEFSFTLVYEIDGEEQVIKDTMIYEYDGIEWAGDHIFSHYKWKSHLKSGNERVTILKIDESNEIYYSITGWDMENNAVKASDGFSKSAWRHNAGEDPRNVTSGYFVSEEELLSIYGIRIISWEVAPPNSK